MTPNGEVRWRHAGFARGDKVGKRGRPTYSSAAIRVAVARVWVVSRIGAERWRRWLEADQ